MPKRASYPIRAESKGNRTIRFIASTKDVARDGGIVEGWELDNYRTNAMVLWAHDSSSLPIGKATKLEETGDALVADIEFAGVAEAHPLAETTYRLIKNGFINSVSVGFNVTKERKPTEDERKRGCTWVAESAELLEISVVPIPADVGAVAISRAARDLDQKDVDVIRSQWGAIEKWAELANAVERVMKRELTESDDAYMVALRPAEDFKEDSFDQFDYQTDPQVVAIHGELVEGGNVIHGLAFPKSEWEMDAAEGWLADNEQAVLETEIHPDEEAPEDEPKEEQAETPEEPEDEEKPEEEQAEETPKEDEDKTPASEEDEDEEEELPRSLIHGITDEARSALRDLFVEVLSEVMEQAPRSAEADVDDAERQAPDAESADVGLYDSLLDLTKRYVGESE